MSEVQNVPGPWKSDGQGSYIFDAKGDIIVEIRGWGHLQYLGEEVALKTQEEIQRRIVAAVNACQGIDIEALEEHGEMIRQVIYEMSEKDKAMQVERDEARAMVKELAAMLRKHEWSDSTGYDEEEQHIYCPECGNTARRGHMDGCELEAIMKKAKALS